MDFYWRPAESLFFYNFMKNVLRKLIPGLLLFSLLSGSAVAQTRIGTVDMKKVFENYWKKKQGDALLKERQADMQKEDKNMLDDYKKMKEDYQGLLASASDQAVSPEERDKRKRAAEDKLKQMKDLEETVRTYETQAQNTLVDQLQRTRTKILEEIRTVISARAKTAGFSLVIDTAAES